MNTHDSLTREHPASGTVSHPPPVTSAVDRVALHVGLALVAWGRRSRRAETERARLARARAERRRAAAALHRADAAERAYVTVRLRAERERREAETFARAYRGGPRL